MAGGERGVVRAGEVGAGQRLVQQSLALLCILHLHLLHEPGRHQARLTVEGATIEPAVVHTALHCQHST